MKEWRAPHALKSIEYRVPSEAKAVGLPGGFPAIALAAVEGIETNAYAAELLRQLS